MNWWLLGLFLDYSCTTIFFFFFSSLLIFCLVSRDRLPATSQFILMFCIISDIIVSCWPAFCHAWNIRILIDWVFERTQVSHIVSTSRSLPGSRTDPGVRPISQFQSGPWALATWRWWFWRQDDRSRARSSRRRIRVASDVETRRVLSASSRHPVIAATRRVECAVQYTAKGV